MSYYSAYSQASRTFYEGQLSWKTGKLSKTKVFAVLLKNDPSFYVID